MAELTSSPVLARTVDHDLASGQDGPHVTTRVDQAARWVASDGQLDLIALVDEATGLLAPASRRHGASG